MRGCIEMLTSDHVADVAEDCIEGEEVAEGPEAGEVVEAGILVAGRAQVHGQPDYHLHQAGENSAGVQVCRCAGVEQTSLRPETKSV